MSSLLLFFLFKIREDGRELRKRELCKDINFTVSRMMVGTEWDVEEGGKSYYTKDLSFILITTGSC